MLQAMKKIIPAPVRPFVARIYHSLVRPSPVEASAETSEEVQVAAPVDLSALKKTADIWLLIDHPGEQAVDIHSGVLSIRGWAWSEKHGHGKLWLTIESEGQPQRTVPVKHRIGRPDVARDVEVIPHDNYAGFEVSVDRFDLPPKCEVTLHYATPEAHYQSEPYIVAAHHAHRIEGVEYPPCNGCGCDEGFTEIGRKDNLPVVQCPRCGLLFTRPRPRTDVIFGSYSTDYFQNMYLKDIQEKLPWLRTHWDWILHALNRYQKVSPELFEVGTGAGYLLDHARTQGWSTSGIDLNVTAAAYARNTLNLDVQQGDITEMELPEGKFGAIILDSTMEHFTDPAGVLRKCAQALAPGGGLFIWTLGTGGLLMAEQGMAVSYVGPSEHLYYFPVSVLCGMCEKAGLRVDNIYREDQYFDSIGLIATKRAERFED